MKIARHFSAGYGRLFRPSQGRQNSGLAKLLSSLTGLGIFTNLIPPLKWWAIFTKTRDPILPICVSSVKICG